MCQSVGGVSDADPALALWTSIGVRDASHCAFQQSGKARVLISPRGRRR